MTSNHFRANDIGEARNNLICNILVSLVVRGFVISTDSCSGVVETWNWEKLPFYGYEAH